MAEPLPTFFPWLDRKKHAAVAAMAQAMQAPETLGPNLWAAVKHLGGAVEDTGDPVQNARNLMMGFGASPLSVHKFTGAFRPPAPSNPRMDRAEAEQLVGMFKGLVESGAAGAEEKAIYDKALKQLAGMDNPADVIRMPWDMSVVK